MHKSCRPSSSFHVIAAFIAIAIAAGLAVFAPAASAISTSVVISQVYGGGGNSGSYYKNDFIELYNRGTTAVSLDGWSVQYASAAGTSWTNKTNLTSVTLQPGQYYLIQEAAGTTIGGGTAPLPTPDATGTIAIASGAGKVALVSNQTTLSGSCPTGGAVVDFVGFGSTATCFEGSGPTPAPSNANAVLRKNGGAQDTDDNSADFSAGAPTPRNTGSPAYVPPPPPIDLHINQVQGSGAASPYAGQTVSTFGIVTAVKSSGFFIQSQPSDDDGDPATSEGVFVYTSSAPPAAAAVGNLVNVVGTVQEYVPSGDASSPPATEIVSPTISLSGSGYALPAPIALTTADVSPSSTIEALERYEGMRVSIDSLTVVAPTQGSTNEANATATSNGVFYGVITGTPRPVREPGVQVPDPLPTGAPANVPRFDANPERIRVDSDALGLPKLDLTTGAVVAGLVGPLDYAYRTYTVLPEIAPTVTGSISAIPVDAATAHEVTIASFNMERFYDTANDPDTSDAVLTDAAFERRLSKASLAIRNVMRAPDIIGVEEMENLATLQTLAQRISADAVVAGQPDPHYQAILDEGNDIGGIDVGFLTKDTVVVDGDPQQLGKDATYIDPTSGQPAMLNDRPSLLIHATVTLPGAAPLPVTVIVNHLRSLNDVESLTDGRVREKRRAQAEYLAQAVQAIQAENADERVVLVGDFNAFQFNDGYVDVMGTIEGAPTPADQVVLASDDLVNPNLVDLIGTVDPAEQYSYVYDGTAQALDHILVSASALPSVTRFEYARNDADFPEVYRSDATRPERLSDHDPLVAYFWTPFAATLTYTGDAAVEYGASLHASVTVGGPTSGSVEFTLRTTPPTTLTAPIVNGSAEVSYADVAVGEYSITATFTGDSEYAGSTTASVTVVDTTSPVISDVATSAASLWPPNKRLMPVDVAVTASDLSGYSCVVTGVTNNETGAADWQQVSDLVVLLRADRSGAGSGRVYTLAITCTDPSGNTATATATVTVPHDQR